MIGIIFIKCVKIIKKIFFNKISLNKNYVFILYFYKINMIRKRLYDSIYIPEFLKFNVLDINNYPKKKLYFDYTFRFTQEDYYLIGSLYNFNFENNKFNYYFNSNLDINFNDTSNILKNLIPNISALYNIKDNIAIFFNNKNGINNVILENDDIFLSVGFNYKWNDRLDIYYMYLLEVNFGIIGLKNQSFFFNDNLILNYNINLNTNPNANENTSEGSLNLNINSINFDLQYKNIYFGFLGQAEKTSESGELLVYYSRDSMLFNKYKLRATFKLNLAVSVLSNKSASLDIKTI